MVPIIATLLNPGASAKGRFVYNAIATLQIIIKIINAVKIEALFKPAPSKILGMVAST